MLDVPGRIPLPSKITIRVLPPLDLRESLGPNPDPEEGYRLVTSTMQRTLTGPLSGDMRPMGRRSARTGERGFAALASSPHPITGKRRLVAD